MPERDGRSCPGCGLANYEGMYPHCRGDQDAYEREFVPPFESSLPDDQVNGFGEFDRFFDEHGYEDGQEPEAFAAWLANKTGARVSGVAFDLSGVVQAEPPEQTGGEG